MKKQGEQMKIECCSKAVLEYEIKNLIKDLKENETIEFKITPCEILEGAFNLEIYTNQESNHSQRKKDKGETQNVPCLGTRSKAEEENNIECKTANVDNYADNIQNLRKGEIK